MQLFQEDESPGRVLPRHTCAPVPLPLPDSVPGNLPQDALRDRARSGLQWGRKAGSRQTFGKMSLRFVFWLCRHGTGMLEQKSLL